jgi:diguanylate cyclase (GGDEF)-like protein
MMIDIDYFKYYNDTYGHSMGDECLKTVADVLSKSVLRLDDFVTRYGGEEFVVVMPNTEEAGACAIAEKLLESIRERNIPHKKNEVADCITVSIGVTTGIVEHAHTAEDFINRADEMMYKAKQGGRNRYIFGKL